jgi:serine/threonine protein kinase
MIGTTVSGRYQIEEQIGIGGMGIVYRARDARLRRDVALKVIAPHLMQQEAARSRFLREAQALAGLTHPNIVTIFDMAEDEDAHTVFLVMELLSGHSLRHYLEEGGSRVPDRPMFSHVALPLCRALEAAHGRGVLHRDIKPENIFVCTDGTLKLMDFGLARLLGDMSKNQSSTVAGTLAYMAPEQLRGETLDARADLYALGIVFYEYLAGQLPFQADNPGALLLKHLTEPPPHLRGLLPDLPQAMDALLTRMLAKEPNARFATAGEIREILERSLPGGGTLTSAVDQAAAGKRAAGDEAKTLQYSVPATLPVMQSLLPTQSTVQAQSKIQISRSKIVWSRSAAAALAGVAVIAALAAGKTLLGKEGADSSARTVTLSTAVIPVSQKVPLSVSKVTPPASAASVPHSEAGAGSLVAGAGHPAPQPSTSSSLPTPNTRPAPNNPPVTPALNTQQIAELETLRREQQEELALLRSLRRQMSEKSAPTPHGPATPSVTNPAAVSGKTLPLLTTKPLPLTPLASSEAGPGNKGAAPPKSLSGGQMTVAAQRGGGTSQYEERRPLPALKIRAWRLPAPEDSKALHVGLRNSVDCNAYFYIIEDDKRRAVRAYPGPERFLALQTQTPNDVRLPFSGDTSPDHQKAVLVIAASHEITGLPATLTLPPPPPDKPPAGATPQQIRAFFGQAMHLFDDEIGQQLQQNHARFAGQPLHPHDILVRVVGLNIGRRMGPRNNRADRVSGSSPEHATTP